MIELALIRNGETLVGLSAHDRRYVAAMEIGIPITAHLDSNSYPARLDSLIKNFYREIAKQLGDLSEAEAEAQCRLQFGVGLMRSESERFDKWWTDLYDSRFNYEELLRIVGGVKIVELMTSKQKVAYLQMIKDQYAEVEVSLAIPDWVPTL